MFYNGRVPIGITWDGLFTKDKIFFTFVDEQGQRYTEQYWIKQQLFLKANKQDHARTLDEALAYLVNQQVIYFNWIKYPVATRMAAFAFMRLESFPSNQLTYAIGIIRNNAWAKVDRWLKIKNECELAVKENDLEVVLNA